MHADEPLSFSLIRDSDCIKIFPSCSIKPRWNWQNRRSVRETLDKASYSCAQYIHSLNAFSRRGGRTWGEGKCRGGSTGSSSIHRMKKLGIFGAPPSGGPGRSENPPSPPADIFHKGSSIPSLGPRKQASRRFRKALRRSIRDSKKAERRPPSLTASYGGPL